MTDYVIADEPRPGGLAHLAVKPFWPLLGVMFGGSLLSWVWFGLNGYALGCPERRRTIAIGASGLVVNAILTGVAILLLDSDYVPMKALPYFLILFTVWKLGVSYWLHILQSRTFHLFEYYGGATRNGMPIVIGGFLLRSMVIPLLPKSALGFLIIGVFL